MRQDPDEMSGAVQYRYYLWELQVAMMLQEIQSKDLRKAAIEQMKILVGLNDTKTIKKLYEVVWGDVHEYGYEL